MNGSAKPVPPPRDHLRIEKDGRLMNRLPAPQVPARTVAAINNNNHREPTKQELDSIRKFEVRLPRNRTRSPGTAAGESDASAVS